MARHRNVRSMAYEDDFDDYQSDEYGTSLENGCITPETEHMYTYARERHGSVSKIWEPQNPPVAEEDESPTDDDIIDTGGMSDKSKCSECVKQVQAILGAEIPVERIREVAESQNYDAERTLNFLLSEDKVQSSVSDLLDEPFDMDDILGQSNDVIDGCFAPSASKNVQNAVFDIGALLAQTDEQQDLNSLLQTSTPLDELLSEKSGTNLDLNTFLPGKNDNILRELLSKPDEGSERGKVNALETPLVSPISRTFEHMIKVREFTTMRTYLNWVRSYCAAHEMFKFETPSPDDVFVNARRGFTCDAKKPQPDSSKTPRVQSAAISIPPMEITPRLTFSGMNIPKATKRPERTKDLEPERELVPRRVSPEPARATASPKPPRVAKFKPEEILSEYNQSRGSDKPLINLVVVGHVDAGKSTLVGHLLYLMGTVSKKVMDNHEHEAKKLGKASFSFAWVLDETEEERQRGITMDMSEAKFITENRLVNVLDAPGHKDFIPNMITGAAQADVAILVVDATTGEFETGFELGGQTREHTMLLRALGISKLAVAVNKLDNCQWSEDRFNFIVKALKPFLKQTGYSEKVQFVPCSGLSGENLSKRSTQSKLVEWYKGPCLVEIIDGMDPPVRAVTKPLRMCVNDIFKKHQSGVCVAGKIETGTLAQGDKIIIMPSQEPCVAKGLTIDDMPQKRVFAGDSVLISLDKIDPVKLSIGSVICDPNDRIKIVTKFEAQIVVFNVETPIIKGSAVILHFQSLSEQANITRLIRETSRSTGEVIKEKPRFLMKNSSGLVVIKVSRPVALELYKDVKELGRITLRQAGKTVAAGIVTNILPDSSVAL